MPECAPFHNYLGEAHALLFILWARGNGTYGNFCNFYKSIQKKSKM